MKLDVAKKLLPIIVGFDANSRALLQEAIDTNLFVGALEQWKTVAEEAKAVLSFLDKMAAVSIPLA